MKDSTTMASIAPAVPPRSTQKPAHRAERALLLGFLIAVRAILAHRIFLSPEPIGGPWGLLTIYAATVLIGLAGAVLLGLRPGPRPLLLPMARSLPAPRSAKSQRRRRVRTRPLRLPRPIVAHGISALK